MHRQAVAWGNIFLGYDLRLEICCCLKSRGKILREKYSLGDEFSFLSEVAYLSKEKQKPVTKKRRKQLT